MLKEWRSRAATIILYVIVAAGALANLIILAEALRTGFWLKLGIMIVVYIMVIVLAVNKGLDYRWRGWGVVAVAYFIVAITQLSSTGLEGIGRIYLLVTPLCALILIGNRAGLIATALSIVIYGVFCLFAYTGMLAGWLLPPAERL